MLGCRAQRTSPGSVDCAFMNPRAGGGAGNTPGRHNFVEKLVLVNIPEQ